MNRMQVGRLPYLHFHLEKAGEAAWKMWLMEWESEGKGDELVIWRTERIQGRKKHMSYTVMREEKQEMTNGPE